MRATIDTMFDLLRAKPDLIPVGHQEPLLEAAGVTQTAIKIQLRSSDLVFALVLRGDVLALTKFRRIEHPMMQAPPHAWVPSAADQARGRKPHFPHEQN